MKKDVPRLTRMKWYDWVLLTCFGFLVALAWTDLSVWLGIESWVR